MPIEAKAQIVVKGGAESLKVLQGIKRSTSDVAREAKKAAQESERWQRLALKSADARRVADEKAARATVKAAESAARAQQKAARDTQRTQEKASQSAAKAAEKAQRDAVRAAEKAQKEMDRLAQREADRWRRLAAQSARHAEREAAKRTADAEKTAKTEADSRRSALRKAGGLLGAATAGVLAGGTVAAGTARGISGVKDIRERITTANEFRERLLLTTSQAGMSAPEREQVQSQVLATSMSTGKDIGELMGVLQTGQAQFNNLRFFAEHLQEIATIAKAGDADTGEFATALGFVQQAFGLTGEEAMEAAYLMKASADKGSVEMKNFASNFAPSAGIFAMNTGQKGLAGVRQFLGTSQGVATGGFGPAESATRMERFITDLNDVDVQKGLRGIGVKNVVDKQTGKIDVAGVIDQLAGNKKFQKASTRQQIFKDVRGQQAVEALLAARSRVQAGVDGAVDLRSIAGVDAAAGRTAVADTMQAMQGEGFFQMQQEAARMQADTVTNLKTYNDQILVVTQAADKLEQSFGALSLWANSIAAAGLASAGASMLGGVASAGSGGKLAKAIPSVANAGAAVSGGAAALLAKGSMAVGAVGTGTAVGVGAAGLALGGALGYGANQLTSALRSDDKTLSDLLAEAMFEAFNKNDARFEKGSRIENMNENGTKRLVTVMEANNRKLESIDQGLRAQSSKPVPSAPRDPR